MELKRTLLGVLLVITVCGALTWTLSGFGTATITTDQKNYSVGQNIVLSGSGFSPNTLVSIAVERPDHQVDSLVASADPSGNFTATYTPPLEPGRYKITATDGVNTAVTASTEADAIAYNKGVYNKSAIAPEDNTGNWTTGNAGKKYLENQWSFYQYQITGIGAASSVPDLDVAFNHFEPSSNAIFVDALADFRACVDCTDSTFLSGPSQGMLLDTQPLPPTSTTNWVVAISAISHINRPLNTLANGTGPAVLSGSSGFCSSDTKEPIPDGTTSFPAQFHCFHVSGSALASLFPGVFATGTHTITLFYAAHLAASFVWGNGTAGIGAHEASLGDCTTIYYAKPLSGPLATFQPIMGGCASGIPIYGTDDYAGWTVPFEGVGFATGSSRHFSISNQSGGSNGALDLPIPTVAAPTNTIIITKATVPSNATATFNYTSSQLGNFSLSNPFPSSKTFTNIAAGVEYDVTENTLAGWTLTNVSCAVTSGADDGSGTWPTGGTNPTAAITLGATDGGVTLTCTYTNSGAGHIIVQKHTNPAGSAQSFAYTTTGTGYTGFSLTDGGSNTDGGTPPSVGLTPGSYTITETAVTGWVLTSRTCSLTVTGTGTSTFPASGTAQPASITLGAGDTVTCVYNNSQPDANVTITPLNPVNEIGNAETFTITVTAIPNGISPVAFTSITPTVNPTAGLTTNTNTCASPTINGNVATCTLTINSTTATSFTAHVAAVVTIGGVALNRATGDSNSGDSADGVKHYVDANITIGPATAKNEVGTQHTFNIVVTALPDGTGTPTFGTVTATVQPQPATLTVGAVTCQAPVANVENCSFTINSTAAGTFTANASTTVTMGGVTVSRATNDTHVGDVGPAVKTYINPATTLTFKSQSPSGDVEAGTPVTITVTETNTGGDPLTAVSVTGSPSPSCATWTAPAGFNGSLAAGASADFTCTFTAAGGTNSWSALGHGTDSLLNPVPATGESASGSFNGVVASTSLTFVSQVPSGDVEAGTSVTITVNEKNTGNGAITGVSVTGAPCATWGGGAATLAAGASANFTCTFTAAVGTNNWSADGHGIDSLSKPVGAAGEHAQGSFSGVLSTLILVKNTVGGNGTFQFAGTGAGVTPTFPVITVGGTKTVIFAGIPSGPKSLSETVPPGWVGDSSNVSCSQTVAGVTPSQIGTLTTGEVLAGGTVSANLSLGVGATVQCTFTNALLPTLTIIKTVQGTGTTTFTFPVTGDNTLNPTITPPPAPGTATYPPGPPTPPPGVPLNVGSNGLTSNNTISELGPPPGWTLTDFSCTGYTGGGTGAGKLDSNGIPMNWNFIAGFGDNVVCTFVDNNAQASRTQGFWATHTQLSNNVWDGTNPAFGTVLPAGATPVIGSGDEVFGPGAGCPVAFTITAIPTPAAENILMGGFWSGISQLSNKGGKRSSIDQARMQMIQQYLAAVLNFHFFGSIGESVLAAARAAYCGTNESAIHAQIGILGNLNQSGDSLGTTPGGSATTQLSKAQADIDAWDTPTNPVD
jgi:hypothetical protein